MKNIGIVMLIVWFLTGCQQENLLQNLEQNQANEVVAVLQRNNIQASKRDYGKSGYSVNIDPRDFSAAVDILKEYDLPSKKPIQVADMFPVDSLVASPRAEKARLYSAIEQRLEQSLHTIGGIVSSRVHVSYDLDAGEGGKNKAPIHLSVLATHEGDVDESALINDIKRFMKNSFAQVDYDNISVVLSKRSALQHAAPRYIAKSKTGIYEIFLLALGLIFSLGAAGYWYWKNRLYKKTEDENITSANTVD